jgi:hypothetical protein
VPPRSRAHPLRDDPYTRAVMDAASDAGPIVPGAGTAPDWRWALPRILALFVATRLLLLAVAVAVETTQASPAAGVRWSEAPLLASLTAYDGRYYLGIAAAGYHVAPVFGPFVDYVFFPLYPALVRLASVVTLGDIEVAGVLVANACFGLALVALYALSIRHLPRDAALRSLVFLSLAPGAVAFGMTYTDGLFLLLSVGAFLAAETRRPALMGVLLALATLTRPPGILLALPLLVLILGDPALRSRRAWVWLALGPLALAGFCAYIGSVTGDPLAWVHGQEIWSRPSVPGGPSGGVVIVVAPPMSFPVLALAGTLFFYLFLFVFFRHDRMPLSYWILAALPFAQMLAAGRAMSVPRFLAVVWPFDWVLAQRGIVARRVVLAVFVALYCVLAWFAFTWRLSP